MSHPSERWRPVVGYEDRYEVSDHGRVRSLKRNLVMTPGTNARGYKRVDLCRSGSVKHRSIHSLVLEAFVGPRPVGKFGLHGDDNPSNNRLDNLRWGTPSENNQDALLRGRHKQVAKTHCPKKHRLVHPNLSSEKHRKCRACKAARDLIAYRVKVGAPVPDMQTLSDAKYREIMSTCR